MLRGRDACTALSRPPPPPPRHQEICLKSVRTAEIEISPPVSPLLQFVREKDSHLLTYKNNAAHAIEEAG
jgi:hypothetical protein